MCHRALAFALLISYGPFSAAPLLADATSSTSLAHSELAVESALAAANFDRACAEHELAVWRWKQLETLRQQGHASWQECALQRLAVQCARADREAAQKDQSLIADLQNRIPANVTDSSSEDREAIQLFLPFATRLVAWIPCEQASLGLLSRHRDDLRKQRDALLAGDLDAAEDFVARADREVKAFSRRPADARLLERAKIRERLATAKRDLVIAEQRMAEILTRRIDATEKAIATASLANIADDHAFASAGTTFVTAELHAPLFQSVLDMASVNTQVNLTTLNYACESVSRRIDALNALSSFPDKVNRELRDAVEHKLELESAIVETQQAAEQRQAIAERYGFEQVIIEHDDGETDISDRWLADPNTLRYWLQLCRRQVHTRAAWHASQARIEYLGQRESRVAKIPESARPPRELQQLRDQIRMTDARRTALDEDARQLRREQRRFVEQIAAQRSTDYQLVQLQGGGFATRGEFELAATLASTVSSVGVWPQLRRLGMGAYLESTSILEDAGDCCRGAEEDEFRFARPDYFEPHIAERPASSVRSGLDSFRFHGGKPRERHLSDLFCSSPPTPSGLHRTDSGCATQRGRRVALRTSDPCDFRVFRPYDTYPFGRCGLSLFSYRFGAPTRASFPYRSSYLYRTAFPSRSNLYSSPFARWPYKGSCDGDLCD